MNEVIIAIQTALSVYVLYLLYLYNENKQLKLSYLIINIYFLLLKLEIISFQEWTTLNYWAWWILNSSIYLFIIYYINKRNGKINNSLSGKK